MKLRYLYLKKTYLKEPDGDEMKRFGSGSLSTPSLEHIEMVKKFKKKKIDHVTVLNYNIHRHNTMSKCCN